MNTKRITIGKVSWAKTDEQKITKNILSAIQLIKFRNGEPKLEMHHSFKFDAHVAIVSDLIRIFGETSESDKRLQIWSSFFTLSQRKNQDLKTFAKILSQRAEPRVDPETVWKIVFPINVEGRAFQQKRWFTIDRRKLKVARWTNLAKQLDLEKWKDLTHRVYPNDVSVFQPPFTPLLAETKADSSPAAFYIAERAYDMLRAAINYHLTGFRSVFRVESGRPSPIVSVPPAPNFGVFMSDGTFHANYYTEFPSARFRVIQLDEESIKTIRAFIGKLHKGKKDSTISLVREGFYRYGLALDIANWKIAFLRLWQVFELITFRASSSNFAFNIKKVRERVKILLPPRRPFLHDLLRLVYDQRNQLVHTGAFRDTGEQDVQNIKALVEIVLLELLRLSRFFPDWESLEIYYVHAETDKKHLAKRIKVLDVIAKGKLNR